MSSSPFSLEHRHLFVNKNNPAYNILFLVEFYYIPHLVILQYILQEDVFGKALAKDGQILYINYAL